MVVPAVALWATLLVPWAHGAAVALPEFDVPQPQQPSEADQAQADNVVNSQLMQGFTGARVRVRIASVATDPLFEGLDPDDAMHHVEAVHAGMQTDAFCNAWRESILPSFKTMAQRGAHLHWGQAAQDEANRHVENGFSAVMSKHIEDTLRFELPQRRRMRMRMRMRRLRRTRRAVVTADPADHAAADHGTPISDVRTVETIGHTPVIASNSNAKSEDVSPLSAAMTGMAGDVSYDEEEDFLTWKRVLHTFWNMLMSVLIGITVQVIIGAIMAGSALTMGGLVLILRAAAIANIIFGVAFGLLLLCGQMWIHHMKKKINRQMLIESISYDDMEDINITKDKVEDSALLVRVHQSKREDEAVEAGTFFSIPEDTRDREQRMVVKNIAAVATEGDDALRGSLRGPKDEDDMGDEPEPETEPTPLPVDPRTPEEKQLQEETFKAQEAQLEAEEAAEPGGAAPH
ncbi:hypothetical protein CXG81DRAFT_17334 [Caulochytrium protostelioides]|uniref:Transmembrane protein n=1 Tax=Caulochytrium protostelioides TaxID=1555241 RepID=A0A4P9WYS3_9FUNG|nr:hypothetical protein CAUPRSCDRAFT_11630 [Caulochytrium protostelioides]RKP03075.1 hypothetical protein CXG81DRAFT_17334 [Caulochytrium protostelioides]|eukprot:RKP03075.1 hypothetical protein CXG81DRAFT_17334 [Caulochytrium protostelioides]